MNSNTKQKQKGFTLVELMIAIAIAGVLLIALFAIVRSVRQSAAVSAETSNVQALLSGVHSIYPSTSIYTGVSSLQLITAAKVPTNMLDAAGTGLVNSWFGAVTIAPDLANGGFDISYANVPASTCIELASALSSSLQNISSSTGSLATPALAATNCASPAGITMVFNSL